MVNLVVNVILSPNWIIFFILFVFVSISPIFCFPLIRAPMLHRLSNLSVLVFILLLVYYHASVLLLEHCHFVCFQFFNLVIHTLWFRCTLFFVWSLSFPLEWVMWKYCHCVWGLVIVWDEYNCSLIFNSGPDLWLAFTQTTAVANRSTLLWFQFSDAVRQAHVHTCLSVGSLVM